MKTTVDELFNGYEAGRLTRRQVVQGLLLVATAPVAVAAQAPSALHGTTIDHVSILVRDLARSRAFYEELFGGKSRTGAGNLVQVALNGPSHLTLTLNPDRAGTLDHVAVVVDGVTTDQALAAARRVDGAAKFEVDTDGVTYFRDPDGTRLQLVARP